MERGSLDESGPAQPSGGPSVQVAQLRPAWINRLTVLMVGRVGPVERFSTTGAEPQAARPAENLVRQREDQRIMSPTEHIEHSVFDVRADQFGRGQLIFLILSTVFLLLGMIVTYWVHNQYQIEIHISKSSPPISSPGLSTAWIIPARCSLVGRRRRKTTFAPIRSRETWMEMVCWK